MALARGAVYFAQGGPLGATSQSWQSAEYFLRRAAVVVQCATSTRTGH